jgi:hypothetical protein
MESFPQAPKFKSPEEELAFLRAHVAERERKAVESGTGGGDGAEARKTLEAYAKTESKEILHEKAKLSEEKMEALVLNLRPESHDRQMEELLGILLENGIKNALDVVEAMDDPHLTDDFHRFLVQYLAATGGVPGLKENNPLWKGTHMKLFEITLPEQGKDTAKGYKDSYKFSTGVSGFSRLYNSISSL